MIPTLPENIHGGFLFTPGCFPHPSNRQTEYQIHENNILHPCALQPSLLQ